MRTVERCSGVSFGIDNNDFITLAAAYLHGILYYHFRANLVATPITTNPCQACSTKRPSRDPIERRPAEFRFAVLDFRR